MDEIMSYCAAFDVTLRTLFNRFFSCPHEAHDAFQGYITVGDIPPALARWCRREIAQKEKSYAA